MLLPLQKQTWSCVLFHSHVFEFGIGRLFRHPFITTCFYLDMPVFRPILVSIFRHVIYGFLHRRLHDEMNDAQRASDLGEIFFRRLVYALFKSASVGHFPTV
ncbi:hypothetical protein NL108_011181 [Boleophthalmus pectinirostris]|nr:hypothetical protein NL108_011181 [Boleophthalmus pectinirostris]